MSEPRKPEEQPVRTAPESASGFEKRFSGAIVAVQPPPEDAPGKDD